jgi:hypothetical protein
MPLKPAPSPDKYEKKDEQDAIAAACAAVPAQRKR